MKRVTEPEFLTAAEIERAHALWRELKGTGRFAAAVEREIIAPNLSRISAALHQENEATVVAFMVEYLLDVIERMEPKPGYLWQLILATRDMALVFTSSPAVSATTTDAY